MKIALEKVGWFAERGVEIPRYIWKQPPYNFVPAAFALHDEKLNDKIYESDVQVQSLSVFKSNPGVSWVYGVAGDPHDTKALYFAAYLVQVFMQDWEQNHPGVFPNVAWEPLYGGFENKLMRGDKEPDLLVLTNLTPNATPTKLEKARDLLARFADKPRIVVVAGDDPITFFARKLFHKVDLIFYDKAGFIKRAVEVL